MMIMPSFVNWNGKVWRRRKSGRKIFTLYIYTYIYTSLGDKQKQKISFEKFSTNLLVQI